MENGYKILEGDEVNSFLMAILRELTTEQMIVLKDALIERTPKPDQDAVLPTAEVMKSGCVCIGRQLGRTDSNNICGRCGKPKRE